MQISAQDSDVFIQKNLIPVLIFTSAHVKSLCFQ